MFKISHHFNHFKRRRCDWFQYISVHISSWNELGLRSFQKERTANLAVCACWDASWEIWKKPILDLKKTWFWFWIFVLSAPIVVKGLCVSFFGCRPHVPGYVHENLQRPSGKFAETWDSGVLRHTPLPHFPVCSLLDFLPFLGTCLQIIQIWGKLGQCNI